jgi:fatty-acyl-CoA synthase
MQDNPLTVGAIVRHGTSVHADRQVRTRQSDGTVRVATFGEVGARTAQLANALRDVGVSADSRVATFMWNNQEMSKPIAPSRRWVRCCTPSTSG